MKKTLPLGALIGLCFLCISFRSDSVLSVLKPSPTIFQHLERSEVLEMTLEYNTKKYVRKKHSKEYLPATMTIQNPDGTQEVWNIELRARGRMRREVCDIPPMKLLFSEEQLDERGLDKRQSLKMVNICRNSEGYEQMLLREYLAYKFYQMVTDKSFKVQLTKVKFVDAEGGKAPRESFAFLIEHEKDVTDRLGMKLVEDQRIGSRSMNSDESEIFTLFQFMIGNTDWFYYNRHNVLLCGTEGSSKIIPIPYDFDYSGIVDTPYSVPDTRLNIRHVTVRYYQGQCRSQEETEKTISIFWGKRKEIMNLAMEFPYLNERSRKHVGRYLCSFFDVISTPKKWEKAIVKHCDLWPVP